jgi:type VI secretion system protein ImpF
MRVLSDGSSVPLFDRLCGAAGIAFDIASCEAVDLHDLVQRELVRLFNVRNSLTIDDFLGGQPTALDYGLPDTLALSPQSTTDLHRFEMVVARAIALYEPRLEQVRVTVTRDQERAAAALIHLSALTAQGSNQCTVHFELALEKNAILSNVQRKPQS